MPSPRPTAWLLLASLLFQSLLTGCQGVTTDPAPGSPASPPAQVTQCGPAVQPTFTQQYLYAGDIAETNNLWVYKIDSQTGVPQPMPWAPIKTTNNSHSGTGDPSGQFVYVGEDNPFSTTDRVIETYRLAPDDGAPIRVGLANSGYPAQLSFDPQGKILYLADPFGALEGSGSASTIEPYTRDKDGLPVRGGSAGVLVPRYESSFGFKAEGNYVIASRTRGVSKSEGSLVVFREHCMDGTLSKVSETAASQGLRFAEIPTAGGAVIGYDCVSSTTDFPGPANGAQLFRFDHTQGQLSAEPSGFYPGICWATVDHKGKYVAASMLRDPQDGLSGHNTLVIYALDSANIRMTETDRVSFPNSSLGQTREVNKVTFDLNDDFLYFSLGGGGGLAAFRLDRATGKLSQLPGSPYPTPTLYSPLFVVGRK